MVRPHCHNSCPTKTAKTVTQTDSKSQNLATGPPDNVYIEFIYIVIYIYITLCHITIYSYVLWSFAFAKTPLLTVISHTGKQKPLELARFLRLTLPKAPLCTVFCSVSMLCEAETTASSDVVELAVAQSTAIYSVLEPAAKKHRNLRCFQQHGCQKHSHM